MAARAGCVPRAAISVVAALLLLAAFSRGALAGGVVGTGVPGSCTEDALDAALGCGAPTGSPPLSNCTGGGSVTFNCGPSPASITVTNAKAIAGDTGIDGGGFVILSGGGTTRLFVVNSGVTLTLAKVTISDGYPGVSSCEDLNDPACSGGAVLNLHGTVAVSDSTFSSNRTYGGPYDPGGGAIANYQGTITVDRSTFSGNTADGGGAIVVFGGTLTVSNSTFVGNTAINGGAIVNVWGYGGTIDITNGTFANNKGSYGGAINNGNGTLTLTNTTFSGNRAAELGGAIYNDGTVTLANTIVANSGGAGNCSNGNLVPTASITGRGTNIDSDGTCGLGPATDPVLDPAGLANNGGPTQTVALQAGSPAINAGDEAICAAAPVNNLDERGYFRPGAGATRCSIGAYEFNSPGAPGNLPQGEDSDGCTISRPGSSGSPSSASLLSLLVPGAVLVWRRRWRRQRHGYR
jgi:predicted outer membrane repeat protein